MMNFILKNVDLYTPQHKGITNVFLKNGKIHKISNTLEDNFEIIDFEGKIMCPAFVDGHEHLKDIEFYEPKSILKSGVGTVVGVLASERKESDVDELIKITEQLNLRYGINAYCLAGSKNYIYDTNMFIQNKSCVIGTKTALFSNQRPKPNLSYEKLKQDALKTYTAGLNTGKKVQLHVHLDHPFPRGEKANIADINSGILDNLEWIDKIVNETGVPYSLFKLTHAQKYYKRMLEYANKGVFIDYTAFNDKYDERFDVLVNAIKTNEINYDQISISSDLGILSMEQNLKEKETPISILNTIKKLVFEKGLKLETILPFVTLNPGKLIHDNCGIICPHCKCNFLILNKKLEIEHYGFFNNSEFQIDKNNNNLEI